MIQREQINIHIDLASLQRMLDSGVLRAYSAVCFALNVIGLEKPNLYPYKQHQPGIVPIQFLPDEMSADQLNEYKEVYMQWTVGNALRELIEIFAIFLDCVYSNIQIVSKAEVRDGRFILTDESMEQNRRELKSFEGKGVLDKLSELKQYGIETKLVDHIETLNTARNCLTHRAGIVGHGIQGERDLNDGNNLTLKWRYMRLFFKFTDGTEENWVEGESRVLPEGTECLMKIEEQIKSTPCGQRLSLHPNEVGQICWNFRQATEEIIKTSEHYLREKGVQFDPSN